MKKNEKLFDSIGDIDSRFVYEASPKRIKAAISSLSLTAYKGNSLSTPAILILYVGLIFASPFLSIPI